MFNLILHRISRKNTQWVAGYSLILIINYLSWIYSTIITCDIVKVQLSQLAVIFFKNISFLFMNFIQTIFESCDKWLKNCWFDNTNFYFELQLWSQKWFKINLIFMVNLCFLLRIPAFLQFQKLNNIRTHFSFGRRIPLVFPLRDLGTWTLRKNSSIGILNT